jgi:cob(I)alamin adenosyltransferase
MSDKNRFDSPQRIAINRVYTRKGDSGTTQLVSGEVVSKGHPRIAAYGTVDELNAHVGATRVWLSQLSERTERIDLLDKSLYRIQHELFNLGSLLATPKESVSKTQAQVQAVDVARLEKEIDSANELLSPLRSFVLPGGTPLNTALHLCRTVCRRAEQLCCTLLEEGEIDEVAMAYLNRLSDAFFIWSRLVQVEQGVDEVLWDPNVG